MQNVSECGCVKTWTDAVFVLKDSLGEVPLFHEDENAFSEKKSKIKWVFRVGKTPKKLFDIKWYFITAKDCFSVTF